MTCNPDDLSADSQARLACSGVICNALVHELLFVFVCRDVGNIIEALYHDTPPPPVVLVGHR